MSLSPTSTVLCMVHNKMKNKPTKKNKGIKTRNTTNTQQHSVSSFQVCMYDDRVLKTNQKANYAKKAKKRRRGQQRKNKEEYAPISPITKKKQVRTLLALSINSPTNNTQHNTKIRLRSVFCPGGRTVVCMYVSPPPCLHGRPKVS